MDLTHLALRSATLGMSPAHRDLTVLEHLNAICAPRATSTRARRAVLVIEAGTVARLSDVQDLAGLPAVGLFLVCTGSVSLLFAPAADAGSLLLTAAVTLALAAVLRASTYRPYAAAAISVLAAVALVWQLATAQAVNLADQIVEVAMLTTSIQAAIAFMSMVPVGRIAAADVPDAIRARPVSLWAWRTLAVSLAAIAMGDLTSAIIEPDGVWLAVGLGLNSAGAALIGYGAHRALAPELA